jgi:hypothetical protein
MCSFFLPCHGWNISWTEQSKWCRSEYKLQSAPGTIGTRCIFRRFCTSSVRRRNHCGSVTDGLFRRFTALGHDESCPALSLSARRDGIQSLANCARRARRCPAQCNGTTTSGTARSSLGSGRYPTQSLCPFTAATSPNDGATRRRRRRPVIVQWWTTTTTTPPIASQSPRLGQSVGSGLWSGSRRHARGKQTSRARGPLHGVGVGGSRCAHEWQ